MTAKSSTATSASKTGGVSGYLKRGSGFFQLDPRSPKGLTAVLAGEAGIDEEEEED